MKDQLIEELCTCGHVSEYKEIIKKIVSSIRSSNCKISCTYNNDITLISQPKEEDGRMSHIRISLKNEREHPIILIWEILHEYGHHLSGRRRDQDSDIEREIAAWDYAFIEMKKYFNSEQDFESFEKYRIKCLETYK
jgi:hypothetical protein